MSDWYLWRVYDSLDQCGYVHGTVNHFQNFVDPVTGVHMNLMEGTWTHAKKLKTMAQVRVVLGGVHVEEVRETLFAHLVNHITAIIYPV